MIIPLAAVSVLLVTAAAAQPVPTSRPQPPVGPEADVRAVHMDFEGAWNRHDAGAMAQQWTGDGDYTEPDGRTAFGSQEVKRLFAYEHASVFKESRLHLAIERVRFVRDDLAITDGSYELFNARDPTGSPIGTRTGYFTSVLVRDGRPWKVSACRLYLPTQLIWREK